MFSLATVNMGILYSRVYYSCLYFLASQCHFTTDWISFVRRFQSHQRVRDLMLIYKEGNLPLTLGRQLAFFRLVKELRVTEEEWNELILELNY